MNQRAGQWPLKEEIGNVHGDWQVIAQAASANGARWRCRCQTCGAERVFYGYTLRAGQARACLHPAADPPSEAPVLP